jgi:hypothetical protein
MASDARSRMLILQAAHPSNHALRFKVVQVEQSSPYVPAFCIYLYHFRIIVSSIKKFYHVMQLEISLPYTIRHSGTQSSSHHTHQ